MKALAIRRYKAPLEMMELLRPDPGPGDLLVRVRAASVNPVDYKIRDGGVKLLLPYSFPLILARSEKWSSASRTSLECPGGQVRRHLHAQVPEPISGREPRLLVR